MLVLAPHPDDESLATGVLIARSLAAGAKVAVAFVTSGDNNPWAQRATERRLCIRANDRSRFGLLREAEALAALGDLGAPPGCARFLRFPDQGLTGALLRRPNAILAALTAVLDEIRPSLVVYPSPTDLHPDHSALGVLTRLSLVRAAPPQPARELTYVVHRPGSGHAARPSLRLHPTSAEAAAKQAAVASHRSQMVWRRSWMFAFVDTTESYFAPASVPAAPDLPVAARRDSGDEVVVTIESRQHWRSWGGRTLVGAIERDNGEIASFLCPLGGHRRLLQARSAATGEWIVGVRRHGGDIQLPIGLAPRSARCFLKLECRFGFFDEGGWLEVPPVGSLPR